MFVIGVFMSCQKEYDCFCTNVNSGATSLKDTYKGTTFAKKAAKKSCSDKMNVELDSLTNCHIE